MMVIFKHIELTNEIMMTDPFLFALGVFFYIGLATLVAYSEPMTYLKEKIGFKEQDYYEMSDTKQLFHRLLGCVWCLSFWITLILTLDIEIAVTVSLFGYILDCKL